MKAVILAGGMGTRISEESHLRPKPMIEIGGRPILWHIMKIYSQHGISDFVICLGYKGYSDQGILRELLSAQRRRDDRRTQQRNPLSHGEERTVAGDAGRYG
jgi:NDP-sugar pyrophosphorylase family protein